MAEDENQGNEMPTNGSGTARLPSAEGGGHSQHHADEEYGTKKWKVMAHGFINGVYTNQTGPRGDDKAYVQSMLMLMANKEINWGKVQFRSMNSLEPLMSNRGYPNLFATGETAGGEPLVDRQHPHDFFMELSARVDVNITDNAALFLYGGPVGEPALGPSVFMHRGSSKYNPEAPITHHWFDSTHITYGVITTGIATQKLQLEASAFRGREPDEERWGIETPKLDSWSVRATFNPTSNWAMQISTGRLKSAEAAHPEDDEQRTTASINYANENGLSAMAAFSNKDIIGEENYTAWLGEVNWDVNERHSIFGRLENVRNGELFPDHHDPYHDENFRISKFQAGYAYRLPITGRLDLALGGSLSAFIKPKILDAFYGNNPMGYNLFIRLDLGK
ncbi:hypothetical protein LPB140_00765 [Sphingorhabdus lutea]|uniref:TonB-dependent receptor n=2 Tax=Sphingorhabdus lutea TaxID=1913578 RepID=A0A1L3JEF8_9SPHN|nr:hypothetical protein LPB140_00765 [Sphingorhabdus lutea]